MAVTSNWFRNVLKLALNKEIDYDTDTIKCMMTTSAYTPNLDTHDYKDDVTNEVTGTGYVAGGATLGTKTITYTAANSLTAWAVATPYLVGDLRRPTAGNTHAYRCIVAGTSHATTEPTWPTVGGATVTDNTVTWAECGGGVVKLNAADTSWANSTITARYAIIYDSTGVDATSPLMVLVNFGADKTSENNEFKIVWDDDGIAYIPVA